ncbi:MAG: transposase [Candidatus Nitrosotenuis sp.]
MKRQIICAIKIRHRRRHDSADFVPLLERVTRLIPIHTIVADRGYDSEQNHVATEDLGIQDTIIRPRYESLQVWKTKGFHRKNMKRHFNWHTYHHRSKAETIFSVIKRILGEDILSRYIKTQNREAMYRITRNYLVIFGWFLRGYEKNKKLKSFSNNGVELDQNPVAERLMEKHLMNIQGSNQ